jgi:hypothetical protein
MRYFILSHMSDYGMGTQIQVTLSDGYNCGRGNVNFYSHR